MRLTSLCGSSSHVSAASQSHAKPTPEPPPARKHRKPGACGRALGRPGKEEVGPIGAKVLRPGRRTCRPKGLQRGLTFDMVLMMIVDDPDDDDDDDDDVGAAAAAAADSDADADAVQAPLAVMVPQLLAIVLTMQFATRVTMTRMMTKMMMRTRAMMTMAMMAMT